MGDVWRSWCLAGATCLGKLYDARLVHFMQACVDSCGGCVVLVVVVVVPHIFVWGSYFLGLSRLLSSPSPPSPSPPPAPSPPPPPPSLLFAHSLITLTHHALTTHSLIIITHSLTHYPRIIITHHHHSLTTHAALTHHALTHHHHHHTHSLTHSPLIIITHSPRTHLLSLTHSSSSSSLTDHLSPLLDARFRGAHPPEDSKRD